MRAAGGREEIGKVPGVGAAEDEAVALYCAHVTERYVEKRVIDFRGERRAIGNGDFHGDAAGCAGGHGEGRAGDGAGGEPRVRGAVDLEGDGGAPFDGDGEPEPACLSW